MKLIISENNTISEVQHAFNVEFPFLRLDFFKRANGLPSPGKLQESSVSLKSVGLRNSGQINIHKEMTVAEFINSLQQLFGLNVRVSRKSGLFWLATTMTEKWSLQRQNELGREISG